MTNKSNNKDLYVSELSFEAEEEDLRKLFSLCGTVRNIHLITDRQTGQRKGTAYVRMASAAEARDALTTLDGTLLINRCIRVRPAIPRGEAPAAEPAGKKGRGDGRRARGRGK